MRVFLCIAFLLAASPAFANEALRGAPGIAVAIGGALRYDNEVVWSRLVELSGGAGSSWVVLPLASANPQRSGESAAKALMQRGARAEVLSLKDGEALLPKVRAARGIYFTGGAQERITAALLDASGHATPLLEAIRAASKAGAVVAGTSAGAAIMSATMIRDAPHVLDVLKEGVRPGREVSPGLGFVGPDIFVDQHFLKRGRIGRLLPAMAQSGYRVGVGVDEDTAVVFQGTTVEVLGYKGALVVDLRDAKVTPGSPFHAKNVRLTYLDRGDRYDLATRVATPSAAKRAGTAIAPFAPGFKPHFDTEPFAADILGDSVIVNLMAQLLDNRRTEAFGLAFGSPRGSLQPALGFEWRLHKGADTAGWFTGTLGGEDYTIVEMRLDVTPVRLAQPLYVPVERKP